MEDSTLKITKKGWTIQEQNYLDELCRRRKKLNWKNISAQMNEIFTQKSRSSKQCRERFHNYIKFKGQEGRKLIWTFEDDQTLFKLYITTGSKRSEISKQMKGRSQNNVKNRFYGQLRKFLRVLNIELKKSELKNKKKIKQATIIKILSKQTFQKKQKITNQLALKEQHLNKLKYDILSCMLDSSQKKNQGRIFQLLKRIHQFNSVTRTQNIRENRMGKKIKRRLLPPLMKQRQYDEANYQIIQYDQKQNIEQKNQLPNKIQNENQQQEKHQQQANVQDVSLAQLSMDSILKDHRQFEKEVQEELSLILNPFSHHVENFFNYSQFD